MSKDLRDHLMHLGRIHQHRSNDDLSLALMKDQLQYPEGTQQCRPHGGRSSGRRLIRRIDMTVAVAVVPRRASTRRHFLARGRDTIVRQIGQGKDLFLRIHEAHQTAHHTKVPHRQINGALLTTGTQEREVVQHHFVVNRKRR